MLKHQEILMKMRINSISIKNPYPYYNLITIELILLGSIVIGST